MGGAVLVHPRPDEVFAELAREWKPAWRRFVAERDAFCGADAERSRAILSFVIRAHLAGLVDHETGLLLQALQELGEGYALLSAPENGLSEELALPRIDVVLATIEAAGYPDASVALGHSGSDAVATQRRTADVVPEVEQSTEGDSSRMARTVSKGLEGYMQCCQILAHPEGRREMTLRRGALRENACRTISRLRWQFSAFGRTTALARSVERRAVQLLLLLTDCEYLVTTLGDQEPTNAVNVLPVSFVRDYTWGTGVGTWVESHGVRLPRELARR